MDTWFYTQAMENVSIDEWELGSLDNFLTQNTWQEIEDFASNPKKMAKSNSFDSSCTEEVKPHPPPPRASTPAILSFGNPDSPNSDPYEGISIVPSKRSHEAMVKNTRPPCHNQDHVIAERKRRENLTKKFIALSGLVPGLKKMDKASVLGESIKYLKSLEEKVKALEEQAAKIKKPPVTEECNSSCEESFEEQCSETTLPNIVAKLSGKSVLLRIYCENRKGVLVKVLSEIDNLNFSVVSTNSIPFGRLLDITVMAQIEDGCSVKVNELVKNLNSVVRELVARS